MRLLPSVAIESETGNPIAWAFLGKRLSILFDGPIAN